MRRKLRKGSKAILSLLLSAVLVMEPLGSAAIVRAEESDGMAVQTETELPGDADQIQENPDSEAGEDQEIDNPSDSGDKADADNESNGENDADSDDKSDDNTGDETTNDSNGETDETGAEEESGTGEDEEEKDTVSENDLEDEKETVSENALDEEEKDEKDETLDGFTEMPEDYQLTSMQMASKRELAAYLDEIMEMDEGGDYAEGELVVLVDSQEEAEQVAEAYNAEIKKLEYGVLTLKLNEGVSVLKAMRVAADEKVNLPAAWPNYYVYAYGEETAETVVESDDLIEVETTEYEPEPADGNVGEEDELSYKAAYTDPYLSPDSGLGMEYQYHHTVIGSAYAWNYGYTGSGVKVAVLDTGVNSSHTDLPSVTGVGTNATTDNHGHGTHVAGIIAALANGKLGVGVAPGVSLYASNVLPNNGSGTIGDTMTAIRAVSGQGGSSTVVDVINMSLGSLGYSADFQTVVTAAYNNGVAIFAAAGNDGGNNYNYPACYDHVISVAATDQSNARASFSNYCNKVDLSAPGVDIYSTDASSTTEYVSMSGTSMACPVAAGEAAVILSAGLDELNGKTGGAKVDALLKVMKNSATKVGSGMGAGITNLAKALNINVITEKPKTPTIDIVADGELQKVTVTMEAQAGTTIYYTDNGKNPVYKNGAPDTNTKKYTKELTISGRAKCDLRAIAVNDSGVCSKVVKKTYTLKPYVTQITISGVNQVAKGKNIQLSAAVMPTYAANKAVTWEIYTADANGKPVDKIDKTSDKTLMTGVSITNKGKVAASKTAKTGSYVVKVTAKDEKKDASQKVIHTPVSETYVVTVTDTVKVDSVKFGQKSLTLVMPTVKSCDLKTEAGFEAKQKDSAGALVDVPATDFKWSSNKEEVATVNANGVVTLHKAGKAVITALANDSSGKKATCTITVKQLATKVKIDGSNVVGKSKKNTYKAVVEPADATNKKVTWSLLEKDGAQWKEVDATRAKAIGVSINAGNGTLSTTKKAVEGVYRIKAVTKDSTETAKTEAVKDVTVKTGLITKLTAQPTAATIYRTTNVFGVITSTTVTVTPTGTEGADLTAYTVTSSDVNGTIATVSEGSKSADGSVKLIVAATGKATGKITLTVKATDGSNKSAKCTIKVNNSASGIRIAPSGSKNECVAKGKTLQLKAVLETGNGALADKKVDWAIFTEDAQQITSQTDKTLKTGMSISTSGKVKAAKTAKSGWYIVCAYARDGATMAMYPIHVANPIKKLELLGFYGKGITLFTKADSGKASLIMTDIPIEHGGYSVSSTNPAVMSVGLDSSGRYMQLAIGKSGSATITIKAMDGSGKQAKYKIQVR